MTQLFAAALDGGDGVACQEGPDSPADNFNFW
jgi:hypothetical protein